MGNIVGDPLDPNVKKQIDIRQQKLGKINRENEDLLFYGGKTAWLRLASSIDIEENHDIFKIIPGLTDYKGGNKLAKACVLYGGTSKYPTSVNDLRFGINTNPDDALGVGAYGFGGGINNYGFSPMPGLTGASVSYYNRGALKKATIDLKVFDPNQLQIIDTLYLRIGYTMLLEWGWTTYFNNKGELATNLPNTTPFGALFSTKDEISNLKKQSSKYEKLSPQNLLLQLIRDQRETSSYNYDAMFGKVSNFSWKFNDDGSYDVQITLIGLGDVVEALKTNISTGPSNLIDLAGKAQAKLKAAENSIASQEGAQNKLTEEFNKLLTNPDVVILDKFTRVTNKDGSGVGVGAGIYNIAGSLAEAAGFTSDKLRIAPAVIGKKVSQWLTNPIFISYIELQGLNINDISQGYSTEKKDSIKKIITALENFVKDFKLINPKRDNNRGIINYLFNKNNEELNDLKQNQIVQIARIKNPGLLSDPKYKSIINGFNENVLQLTLDIWDTGHSAQYLTGTGLAGSNYNLNTNNFEELWYIFYNVFNHNLTVKKDNISSTTLFDATSKESKLSPQFQKINNLVDTLYDGSIVLYPDILSYIQKLRTLQTELDRLNISLLNKENIIIQAQKELEKNEIIGAQSYIKYAYTTAINKFLYFNIYMPLSSESPNKTYPLEYPKTNEDKDTTNDSPVSVNDINDINKLFPDAIYKRNFKTKGTLNSSIDFSQYYIKLGALLKFIEKKLLLYNSNNTDENTPKISSPNNPSNPIPAYPLFTFDLDKNNICLSYKEQISADPLICIINKSFKETTNNNYVGKPLEIYVNINHISNCVQNNIDKDGGVNLLSFLKALITGINDALGNINKLDFIYNEETNKVILLEESNLNDVEKSDSSLSFKEDFRTFGVKGDFEGSFITNVDFTVQLPPNMAAMATISAQANSTVVGENATALSNLNKGLIDRIIPEKLDALTLNKLQDIKKKIKTNVIVSINSKDTIEKQIKKYIDEKKITISVNNGQSKKLDENEVNDLTQLLLSDPDIILIKQQQAKKKYVEDIYNKGLITQETVNAFKTTNRDLSLHYISLASNKPSELVKPSTPAPFFMPFNLSLTMDGLSGMVNYQRFTISKDVLPSQYRNNEKLNFIIKGITHDIKDNYWETKIESISVGSKPK